MNEAIDIYCERLGPGFWAEPINAITNMGFLIATFLLFLMARRDKVLNTEVCILIGLLGCIGIGSWLFHTLAVRWAMLADVLPILLFQISFIVIYGRRVMNLGPTYISILLLGFVLLSIGFESLPRAWLNGSLAYLPAILYLLGFAFYHRRTGQNAQNILLLAVCTFAVSLTFRSIDMMVCPVVTFGTHFLWHLLNAVVLYLCVYAVIKNEKVSP